VAKADEVLLGSGAQIVDGHDLGGAITQKPFAEVRADEPCPAQNHGPLSIMESMGEGYNLDTVEAGLPGRSLLCFSSMRSMPCRMYSAREPSSSGSGA